MDWWKRFEGPLVAAGVGTGFVALGVLLTGETNQETAGHVAAIIGVVILGLASVLFLGAFLGYLQPAWDFARRWEIRIRDKTKPLAHQYLLDIANAHAVSPKIHFSPSEAFVFYPELDNKLPFLRIRLVLWNDSVHELLLEGVGGRPTFFNEEAEREIEAFGGLSYVMPPNTPVSLDLRQYVPSAFVEGVRKEIEGGEVRCLNLSSCFIRAKAKLDSGVTTSFTLGDLNQRFRVNPR